MKNSIHPITVEAFLELNQTNKVHIEAVMRNIRDGAGVTELNVRKQYDGHTAVRVTFETGEFWEFTTNA